MSQQTLRAEPQVTSRRAEPRARLKLLAGSGNPALAREIADAMDVPLSDLSIFRYADGEIGVRIEESVRGEDVFV
ncbi:MAG: ribose-phosphate pyrophosphokinase-like domain-containing protein, partial [Dehalococcoidia bacterium]|nr:ribose-phosphate pyrophosphokinase-like domain-containing protein [Dehalococcoidia bacterium]